MWDWDAIDADYFTNSSGGQAAAAVAAPGGVTGPPAILSAGNQMRPTTTAGKLINRCRPMMAYFKKLSNLFCSISFPRRINRGIFSVNRLSVDSILTKL